LNLRDGKYQEPLEHFVKRSSKNNVPTKFKESRLIEQIEMKGQKCVLICRQKGYSHSLKLYRKESTLEI